MSKNIEQQLQKIHTLQDVIVLQIPLETTLVFGEFEEQPMRSVWSDDELVKLKEKMIDLINTL